MKLDPYTRYQLNRFTGSDFANKFFKQRGQRTMRFYWRKIDNARHQVKKYTRCF